MRWRSGRRSQNVEDRRNISFGRRGGMRFPGGGMRFPGGGMRFPGGGMRLPGGRRGGIGGLLGLLAIVGIALFLGVDPGLVLNGGGAPVQQTAPADEPLADFVSVVLADTEDTWQELFQDLGGTYQEPKLVLFSGGVDSACGLASAAVGPFYCPSDRQIYIDLAFLRDLAERFHAPGDFAQAYVIAHEVGHHVQNLLGISEEVRAAQQQADEAGANALSVKLELQADCFAGVWAHHAHEARQILESGDVEEGLGAAAAIGDDRLQRRSQGYVVPETFTHGTSEQRVRWFEQGLDSGALDSCNTFAAGQA